MGIANGNGQGCAIFSVPGNEPSTPTTYPPGVAGPCTQVAPGTVCPDHGGTCTSSGVTYPVCCPTCATGTYLPGDSCNVTLPDGLTPTTCAAANPDSGGIPVPVSHRPLPGRRSKLMAACVPPIRMSLRGRTVVSSCPVRKAASRMKPRVCTQPDRGVVRRNAVVRVRMTMKVVPIVPRLVGVVFPFPKYYR